MKYEIVIAQSALDDFKRLDARHRTTVKAVMRRHLEHSPDRLSRSRIKRLRGLRQPQYRLRVDDVRVYYDINEAEERVEVLGIVLKPETFDWLDEHGVPQ